MPTVMYCRRCREKNDQENRFCLKCGLLLNPEAAVPDEGQEGTSPPAEKPRRKLNPLLWIIPAALCILVGAYSAVLWVTGARHLANSNYVVKNAEVASLLFYEEGADPIPYGQREYGTRFLQEDARFICWELTLEHPSPDNMVIFPITQIYYRPSGVIDGKDIFESYIEPGWFDSVHSWGFGWEQRGYWQTGTYTVELYVNDYLIATGKFDIY